MTVARRTVPAVVLLTVVATGTTALADPAPAPAAPARPVTPVTVDAAALARSDVLAGYRVVADGGLTHRVTATVTVPTVDCATRGREPLSTTVSLFGDPVETDGTNGAFATVDATCRRGRATYDAGAFSTRNGTGVGFAVAVQPGDVLTMTATSGPGASAVRITTADGTPVLGSRGDGFHVQRAQVVTQGGYGGTFPRPTAPVAFTRVSYDGAPLAAAAPQRLTQVDDTGAVIARASGLGTAGNAFTVRFTAAP